MKEDIRNWFLKPFYVWEYTTTRKIIIIILIELFSIGFKVIYQPELLLHPFASHSLFYLGHGFINVSVLITVLFLFPRLFNGYFIENKRTIGREIVLIIALFTLLTFSHALLMIVESNMSIADSVRESLYINIKIGVFPIAILLLMATIRSLEIKLQEQELYTSKYLDTSSQNRIISIKGEVESLKIVLGDLYYIKSSNNYSEIYYLKKDKIIKKVIRVPISTVEKELNSDFLYRVHRSYLINFLNTKKVLGNANSCFVLLNRDDLRIPVSRVKRAEILSALEKLPIQTMV